MPRELHAKERKKRFPLHRRGLKGGAMRYLDNVTTLRLDTNKCTGCGRCIEVCPHEVFEKNGKKAVLRDRDACMECGGCSKNCPAGAIDVRPGVGCAYAIVLGKLKGTEPQCGCDTQSSGDSCA